MRSLLSLILFILWAGEGEEVEVVVVLVVVGQKQEQFNECVANEGGSSFQKTRNLRVEDLFCFFL